jgi:hypothetical protein
VFSDWPAAVLPANKSEVNMEKINYPRLIVGALLVGIFYFVADGFIHGAILGPEHAAAITEAGKPLQRDPTAYAYFFVFDFGKAFVALIIYAAARPSAGISLKAAIWSGLIDWLATEALPSIAAMPFPFYQKSFYLKWIGLEIAPMVIGAILGAWIYKEPAPASSTS